MHSVDRKGMCLFDDLSRPQIDRQTGWDFYGLIVSLSIHYSAFKQFRVWLFSEIIEATDFYFTPYTTTTASTSTTETINPDNKIEGE